MSGQASASISTACGEVFLQLDDHPVSLGVDLFRGELLVDGADHGGDAVPSTSSGGTAWAPG